MLLSAQQTLTLDTILPIIISHLNYRNITSLQIATGNSKIFYNENIWYNRLILAYPNARLDIGITDWRLLTACLYAVNADLYSARRVLYTFRCLCNTNDTNDLKSALSSVFVLYPHRGWVCICEDVTQEDIVKCIEDDIIEDIIKLGDYPDVVKLLFVPEDPQWDTDVACKKCGDIMTDKALAIPFDDVIIKGRIETFYQLLQACADCFEDVLAEVGDCVSSAHDELRDNGIILCDKIGCDKLLEMLIRIMDYLDYDYTNIIVHSFIRFPVSTIEDFTSKYKDQLSEESAEIINICLGITSNTINVSDIDDDILEEIDCRGLTDCIAAIAEEYNNFEISHYLKYSGSSSEPSDSSDC